MQLSNIIRCKGVTFTDTEQVIFADFLLIFYLFNLVSPDQSITIYLQMRTLNSTTAFATTLFTNVMSRISIIQINSGITHGRVLIGESFTVLHPLGIIQCTFAASTNNWKSDF